MEQVPATPPVEKCQARIDALTVEVQHRESILNAVQQFGGLDSLINSTIMMKGRIEGLKESMSYTPQPTSPAAPETPAVQEGDGI